VDHQTHLNTIPPLTILHQKQRLRSSPSAGPLPFILCLLSTTIKSMRGWLWLEPDRLLFYFQLVKVGSPPPLFFLPSPSPPHAITTRGFPDKSVAFLNFSVKKPLLSTPCSYVARVCSRSINNWVTSDQWIAPWSVIFTPPERAFKLQYLPIIVYPTPQWQSKKKSWSKLFRRLTFFLFLSFLFSYFFTFSSGYIKNKCYTNSIEEPWPLIVSIFFIKLNIDLFYI
jgi:hypothetical protein